MKKIIRRLVVTLLFLLITFALLFGLGIWALQNGHSIFNLGMPVALENWVIIGLSFIGIIMVILELGRIDY